MIVKADFYASCVGKGVAFDELKQEFDEMKKENKEKSKSKKEIDQKYEETTGKR